MSRGVVVLMMAAALGLVTRMAGAEEIDDLASSGHGAIGAQHPHGVVGPAVSPLINVPARHRVGIAVDELGDRFLVGHNSW